MDCYSIQCHVSFGTCIFYYYLRPPCPVAQSVASPTTDPGVASSIPVGSNTFVEVDHEISSTVILLLPLIQEGWLTGT